MDKDNKFNNNRNFNNNNSNNQKATAAVEAKVEEIVVDGTVILVTDDFSIASTEKWGNVMVKPTQGKVGETIKVTIKK